MTEQEVNDIIATYEQQQADEWSAYELGDCGE